MPKLEDVSIKYIAGAQHALIEAVHESQWLITIFVLLAFWLLYLIPVINIHDYAKEE